MGYFRIAVTLKDNTVHSAIRQLELNDIDVVWRLYFRKAKSHYKNQLESFSAVQLSKLDPEVRAWIRRQGKKELPPSWVNDDYKLKPRRGKSSGFEGKQLGER